MAYRIREISSSVGHRARLTLAATAGGVRLALERPGQRGTMVELDVHGAEILAAYLGSAQISGPFAMPPEAFDGPLSTRLDMAGDDNFGDDWAVRVMQPASGALCVLPAGLWERLAAELALAIPHARLIGTRRAMLH